MLACGGLLLSCRHLDHLFAGGLPPERSSAAGCHVLSASRSLSLMDAFRQGVRLRRVSALLPALRSPLLLEAFRQGARLRRASERLPASGSLLFAGPKRSNQEKWPGELGERQELGARAMIGLRLALRGATGAIPRALGYRGKGSAASTCSLWASRVCVRGAGRRFPTWTPATELDDRQLQSSTPGKEGMPLAPAMRSELCTRRLGSRAPAG